MFYKLGVVSWKCFPEELKRVSKQEHLPQTEMPFPENLLLLAVSLVAYKFPGQHQLIQQVPSTSCSLPSWAEMVPGVGLENSVPQKLHFQNQNLFLYFVFLVDHFQCSINVEQSLKQGLLPVVQYYQRLSSQHFLHNLEK